jgi:Uma2 family endonuclease
VFIVMAMSGVETHEAVEGDQCVTLHRVDWRGYSSLLRIRGEGRVPRITYLDGTVWLMSPAYVHERLSTRLGLMVMTITLELGIPCTPAASTTFRRKKKKGGVEGDQTYYLTHEPMIRGKDELSLKVDPPPDLAIEAVNTNDATASIEVYRRFGVPEVWVCDASEMQILVLQPDGRYAQARTSAVFPFLTADEVLEWVSRPVDGPETSWLRLVVQWVKETLKPRFDDLANDSC